MNQPITTTMYLTSDIYLWHPFLKHRMLLMNIFCAGYKEVRPTKTSKAKQGKAHPRSSVVQNWSLCRLQRNLCHWKLTLFSVPTPAMDTWQSGWRKSIIIRDARHCTVGKHRRVKFILRLLRNSGHWMWWWSLEAQKRPFMASEDPAIHASCSCSAQACHWVQLWRLRWGFCHTLHPPTP